MAMTSAKVKKLHPGINLMRHGNTKKRVKWHAWYGGNGTGEPVVSVAEAYHLVELEKRIQKYKETGKEQN